MEGKKHKDNPQSYTIPTQSDDANALIRAMVNQNVAKIMTASARAVQRAVLRGAEIAKEYVTVDTGDLRAGIHAEDVIVREDCIIGTYGTNSPYGAYVEFGTGRRGAASPHGEPLEELEYKYEWEGIEAQPYMYPASLVVQKELPEIMVQCMQEELTT